MIFPMTFSGAKHSAVGTVQLYGPHVRALFARRTTLTAAALITVAACAVLLALPAATPAEIIPQDTTFGWMARV